MGERQTGDKLKDIRADHRARYDYACGLVFGNVIDLGCGIGYGSWMMANQTNVSSVHGVEKSIDIPGASWQHPRIGYTSVNLEDSDDIADQLLEGYANFLDWAVAFEIVEHLGDPRPMLRAAAVMADNILLSVPNETLNPFKPSRFPYHHRHYTMQEIDELCRECGLDPLVFQYNQSRVGPEIGEEPGPTIIVQCRS